ncbi:50S ribosomal protein L28 [symbiont of Argiope bruennichi]|uniref:50S ribosomal protein L28 n=1 Tax=symbiont of Argiope bruennichi TaxID=2810479 RepID=UPI003DA691A1
MKICLVTGKRKRFGNNRSHAMNATRRFWKANMQTKKILINGKKVKVCLSNRGFRTLKKWEKQ